MISGVKATNGYYDNKIIITWNAYPSADIYTIFKRPINGGMLVEVENTTDILFEDDNVIPGIIYLYFVSAKVGETKTDLNFSKSPRYYFKVPGIIFMGSGKVKNARETDKSQTFY